MLAATTLLGDEEGQIVSGWFLRILFTLAVVAFLAFEFGSIAVTRFQAGDIADQAATQGSCLYATTHDVQKAQAAADQYARGKNATLTGFNVDAPGKTVSASIMKTAPSKVLPRFSATKSWVRVHATGTAPIPQVVPATCQ